LKDNKLLASLAVFRSLDKEGKTINEILLEFLIDIIKSEHLHQFRVSDMSALLNKIYDFQIPDAVIKTSLKKIEFISVSHHEYTVNNFNELNKYTLEEKQNEMEQEYSNILDKLYFYIEEQKRLPLDSTNKKDIENAFTNFILDNSTDNGYSDYISAFIIENKRNQLFMNQLEMIKEGVILYTGLKFNPQMNLTSKWNEYFTIYLNTEIIFHMAGYNGELYKELYDDFYKLVKDVNRNKQYIQLKYFEETEQEIKSFFYAAEKIVNGESSFGTSTSAMKMLVNGSKSSIDILAKKAQLFELLKSHATKEEKDIENTYTSQNYQYNIDEKKIIEKYNAEYTLEYLEPILKKLNFISIKRAEREKNNFEQIGYILLTENSKINMIAWDEDIKHQGDVPLTTNLQFITNKLWFKLNKGFGTGDYPASFKVITKAQTLLASHLSDKLSKEYSELQTRVKNGEMTEEVALTVLLELRNRSKMPEDLCNADMTSVLTTITEEKLDDYALQYENTLKKIKNETEKNQILKEELENRKEKENKIQQKNKEILQDKRNLEKKVQDAEREKELEKNKLLKKLLEEKEKNYFQMKREKELVDTKLAKILKREQYLGTLAYICVILYVGYYYIDWNTFEKWAWIGMTFFAPLVMYIMKKYLKIIQNHILSREKEELNKLYLKFKIDIKAIEKMSQEIIELKNEIK